MNSQNRIAAVYFVAVLLLAVLAMVLLRYVILHDFVKLEEHLAMDRLDGGYKMLEGDGVRVAQVLRDYAAWTHSCKFIKDLNDDYRQENLRPEVFGDIDINFMAFLDADGNWRDGVFCDDETKELIKFPPELRNYIVSHQRLWRTLKIGKSMNGIARAGNHTYTICVSPVTTETRVAPIYGYMLMGRLVSQQQLKSFSEALHHEIKLEYYPSADWHDIQDTKVRIVNSSLIQSAKVLNDFDDKPVMIMVCQSPRSIYQNGVMAFNRFIIWYLGTALILFCVVYLALKKWLFAPIEEASARLSKFIRKGDGDKGSGEMNSIASLLDMAEKTAVALEHESALRAKLISEIPVGVFIVDENSIIRDANRMALRICGYKTAEEVVGKNYYATFLQASEPHDIGNAPLNRDYVETYFYRKDGSRVPVLKTSARIKVNHEDMFFESFIDLSEAGEAAAHISGYYHRLEKMVNDLQSMNKILHREIDGRGAASGGDVASNDIPESAGSCSKSAFLANVSDAIRTPLTSLIGFIGLLQESNLNEENKHYVDSITSSSNNLLEVMNTIIDVAKLESGTVVMQQELIYASKLVNTVFERAKNKHRNRNEVMLVMSPPDPFEELAFRGDCEWLQRALEQLVDNSFKFTHMGRVEIGYRRESDHELRVYVSDTGIGMTVDQKAKIFDLSNQAEDVLAKHYSGIGLGMTVCVKVASLLGGQIKVESVQGKGTTIYYIFEIAS